jgi:O-antigen ligase
MIDKLVLWLLTLLTALTIGSFVYVGALIVKNFYKRAMMYARTNKNVHRSYTDRRKVIDKDNRNGD